MMEKIFQGLARVTVYIDNILVTGESIWMHWWIFASTVNLLAVAQERKCSFMQPSVEYLGYTVDKDGLHATHPKIEAIVNATAPRNIFELRAFHGFVNCYRKFTCTATQSPVLSRCCMDLVCKVAMSIWWPEETIVMYCCSGSLWPKPHLETRLWCLKPRVVLSHISRWHWTTSGLCLQNPVNKEQSGNKKKHDAHSKFRQFDHGLFASEECSWCS